MILTVKKIMKDYHYLTAPERALQRLPYEVGIVSVGWIIYTIIRIIKYGFIEELHETFRPINIILTAILILIALCVYLRGIIYIKKFNNAYKNGIRYIGCPVIDYNMKVRKNTWGTSIEYRALVHVTDDVEVYTPVYNRFSDNDKYCDVYYYKKKYYFCLFRKHK